MTENETPGAPAPETSPAETAPPVGRSIDRVIQAYRSTRRPCPVPEWDGLTLYFGRFTSADLDTVESQMREMYGVDAEKWPKNEFRVRQIVHKAELEDGSPAFLGGDVAHLMTRVPVGVITRIYVALLASGLSGDDAAGKSNENPDSDSD